MTLSLKWRIQLWYALILLVVLAVLGTGFYFYEKGRRLAAIDRELDQHVHAVFQPLSPLALRRARSKPDSKPTNEATPVESLTEGWIQRPSSAEEEPRLEETACDALASRHRNFEGRFVPRGFYAKVERKDEPDLQYTSSNFPDLDFPAESVRGFFLRTRDNRFRELYHENTIFRVITGYDLQGFRAELWTFKLRLFGGLFLLFALALTVGYFIISRSLRHLVAIESTAEKIAEAELDQRIPDTTPRDAPELISLTHNLNHTFSQLESLFQRQIRFTADASHELRTPLTALLVQLEHGLKRPRTREEYERILEVSLRSTNRVRRITEQLIELARYDSGRVKMEFETLSLDSLLTSLAEELEPYIRETGGTLRTGLTTGLVKCDPFRLEQVITNLVNNAVQHNPQPVDISIRNHFENGHAVIEVVDNGKGIQPENLGQIFDRFFQESRSRTKENGEGNVGLGLAISQMIIKAHGGTLSVRSEPGVKTAFTIRIPGGGE